MNISSRQLEKGLLIARAPSSVTIELKQGCAHWNALRSGEVVQNSSVTHTL